MQIIPWERKTHMLFVTQEDLGLLQETVREYLYNLQEEIIPPTEECMEDKLNNILTVLSEALYDLWVKEF